MVELTAKKDLTSKDIVAELDRFIIGQQEAKRALAIALRNRYRRQKVAPDMRAEIFPHNILLIGPTGVGKTELARRLAKLTHSPFIKVEATKFTEVGYVGRDVDSIIRDLLDLAINQVRERMRAEVAVDAKLQVEEVILNEIIGENASPETREKFRTKLYQGELDEMEIEVELTDKGQNLMHTMDVPGAQMGLFNIGDLLGKALGGKKTKKIKMKVTDAYTSLLEEEADKLLNEEQVIKLALKAVEEDGIVFLDEIDKIASNSSNRNRGEVSREGVQRDLLPLIEGTVVSTKYGSVKTNHILFIGSGAFHTAKPSDLLPELQGRLPIKVELSSLSQEDLVKILTDREYSLPKQYEALLKVENLDITFTQDGLEKIAEVASQLNDRVENLGARRLQAIFEKVLEDISFEPEKYFGQTPQIDAEFVTTTLASLLDINLDISKFIL
jgi:ATP-dependent HslUV protease ATP-binding subunit HslU